MSTTEALAALIDRYSTGDGIHPTAIPRLSLIRAVTPTEPLHTLHQPALCIIAHGHKQVMLGEDIFLRPQPLPRRLHRSARQRPSD